MAPPKINIMHAIRLQLKTGYRKTEPVAYQFMKRFPPLDSNKPIERIKPTNKDIPYLHLYHKAIERNVLNEEFVYPAYWREEPKALIIAKKQYQHMIEDGDNEEDAYEKAEQYLNELENQEYLKLKSLYKELKKMKTKVSFMNDFELMKEINYYKENYFNNDEIVLYEDLELSIQGEIDYLLQVKILKWNEIERKRRMKDPIFILQFEKLRNLIFYDNKEILIKQQRKEKNEIQYEFLSLYDIDINKIGTTSSFYVEDYVYFFEKVSKEPNLQNWEIEELEIFSTWIIETLALQVMMENQPSIIIQNYLEKLREHFFPMIKYTKKQYNLPSTIKEFKRLLYDHDIGYYHDTINTEQNKLYIQRFYKLPSILFPMEMLIERLMKDPIYVKQLLEDDHTSELLKEMNDAGINIELFSELKIQLKENYDEYNLSSTSSLNHHSSSSSSSEHSAISTLDEILNNAYNNDTTDDDTIDDDNQHDNQHESDYTEEEWNDLIKKYKKPALTELEQDRDRIYSLFEYNLLENATTEEDLQQYYNLRLENSIIAQARMEKIFNEKEAARLEKEWRQRGVWLEDMPNPVLPLV